MYSSIIYILYFSAVYNTGAVWDMWRCDEGVRAGELWRDLQPRHDPPHQEKTLIIHLIPGQ